MDTKTVFSRRDFIRGAGAGALALGALAVGLDGNRIKEIANPLAGFRIGFSGVAAAGTADYTSIGTNDNVQGQAALNALPSIGGRITYLAGNFVYGATISRAINNVTIEGLGNSTYIAWNGASPLISLGATDGWVIKNLKLDAGGIDFGTATNYTLGNVWIGTQHYSAGRGASCVIAAFNATTLEKGQADYIEPATGWESDVQAKITANAGGKIVFLGTFTKSTTASLLVPSNTMIDIQSAVFAFVASINLDAVVFENAGKWGGNTGIRIIGGTINLNATNNTGRQMGIIFHNVTDSVIDVAWQDYDGVPYQLYDCYNIKTNPSFEIPSVKFMNRFDADVVKVTKNVGNPLTTPYGETWGSVWKEDSAHYHMFVQGSSGIDHWTAGSGGTTWTADAAHNPVLIRGGVGTWDNVNAYCSMVWKESSTYYMLYGGLDAGGVCKVGLATSSDMLTWVKNAGNPVFQGTDTSWGPGAEPWGIIKVGAEYQLWYNNYGGTGGGHSRMLGRATSTDLINWTPDLNNPIYAKRRFCPWIFCFGGSPPIYYMFVTKQDTGSSSAYFEVYRDNNPTFYANERVYLGNLLYTTRDAASWEGGDMDCPSICISNINQSIDATPKLYYSAMGQSTGWKMGLATFASTILESGALLPDYYTSTSTQPATLPLASIDTLGLPALKIVPTTTLDTTYFPVNSKKGSKSFWHLQTSVSSTYMFAELVDDFGTVLGYWDPHNGSIYFDDNGVGKNQVVSLVINSWYFVTLEWDSNIGEYSITMKDNNLNIVWQKNHLKMVSRSTVNSLRFNRSANPGATVYLGGLYTDSEIPPMNNLRASIGKGEIRTISGTLAGVAASTNNISLLNPFGQAVRILSGNINSTAFATEATATVDVGIGATGADSTELWTALAVGTGVGIQFPSVTPAVPILWASTTYFNVYTTATKASTAWVATYTITVMGN